MSNKVFVGNIQYSVSAEEIQELFSRAGECRFELHYDKANGRSSGYGFCEFKDEETAALAIEKFNGFEMNGRQLNVSYPTTGGSAKAASTNAPTTKASAHAQMKSKDIQRQPPMPALPGSVSQKVNSVMDSMSIADIYDILMAIKEDPDQGRRHLQMNPSLAYALLQAQVILGYIPAEKAPQYFMGAEASSSMAIDPNPVSAQAPPSYAPAPSVKPPAGFPTNVAQFAPTPSQAPPPPSAEINLATLARMDPSMLPAGLPPNIVKLLGIIHKAKSMSSAEFASLEPRVQEELKRAFLMVGLPLPSV